MKSVNENSNITHQKEEIKNTKESALAYIMCLIPVFNEMKDVVSVDTAMNLMYSLSLEWLEEPNIREFFSDAVIE